MSEILKRCPKCERWLPQSAEYFNRQSDKKTGFRSHCKACEAEYRASIKDRESEKRKNNKNEIARKRKLNREKNSAKIKEQERVRRLANKDKISENNRKRDKAKRQEEAKAYYAKNAEKLREGARVYREKNKEKLSEKRLSDREKSKERERKWRTNNPAKSRAITLRKRARRKSLPDTLTAAQWQRCLEYWGGCCAYCGRPAGLFHTMAMEHFSPLSDPNSLGTVAGNILPACHGIEGCNNHKSAKPAAEWLELKFGPRKAKQILKRITAYFAWATQQTT